MFLLSTHFIVLSSHSRIPHCFLLRDTFYLSIIELLPALSTAVCVCVRTPPQHSSASTCTAVLTAVLCPHGAPPCSARLRRQVLTVLCGRDCSEERPHSERRDGRGGGDVPAVVGVSGATAARVEGVHHGGRAARALRGVPAVNGVHVAVLFCSVSCPP